MQFTPRSRAVILHTVLVAFACTFAAVARGQQMQKATDAITSTAASTKEALSSFIDQLPDLLDLGLPGFAPPGALRFYTHPRFGDLLHEDYFRLPVGARLKVNDQIELNAQLGAYFTHGLGKSVGNGLYEARVGAKTEQELWSDIGSSAGIDFVTPLDRPPHGITDGLRHTLPYLTLTRPLLTRVPTLGFVTFGADLIDHTALPVDYRKNELHANSLMLTVGAAREWRHMHVILQVTEATTTLTSHLHQNAFGIRPSLGIPVLRRPDGTPRATVTFEGRTVWGPDGLETGLTTSVRFDLHYRRGRKPNGSP